jgi:vacuolar protein sorting-associated protein 51
MEEPRRRTARALLESYRTRADQIKVSDNPLDVDSPEYDAERHFDVVLRQKSLKQLLALESQTKRQVKNLDSEMKTLVEENYNKFIAATVTIRAMQEQVDDVELEMQRLGDVVQRLTVVCQRQRKRKREERKKERGKLIFCVCVCKKCDDAMEERLNPHRRKIQELDGVANLLKQRQFLFEMPSRLRRSMQMEAYATTVSYYTNTAGILNQYCSIPSFKAILDECESIVDGLRSLLRRRATSDSGDCKQCAEAAQLLLELGEDRYAVRVAFLGGRANLLASDLKRHRHRRSEAIAGGDDDADDDTDDEDDDQIDMIRWMSDLNMAFLTHMIDAVQAYESLFNDEQSDDKAQLATFGKQQFGDFFALVSEQFARCVDARQVIGALEILQRQLSNIAALIPSVALGDRAVNVIHRTVHSQIDAAFARLSARFADDLARAAADATLAPGNVRARTEAMARSLASQIEASLDELRHFVDLDATPVAASFLSPHRASFVMKIGLKVQQMLLNVTEIASAYFGVPTRDREPQCAAASGTLFVLSLSRLFLTLRGVEGIGRIQRYLARDLLPSSGGGADEAVEHVAAVAIEQQLDVSARFALAYYVRVEACRISKLVRSAVETSDWTADSVRTPRGVRSAVKLLTDELACIEHHVVSLYPSSKSAHNVAAVEATLSAASSSSSPSSSAVATDAASSPAALAASRRRRAGPHGALSVARRSRVARMDQLFVRNKLGTFGQIEPSQPSIMICVCTYFIKTFVECVRTMRFSKNALQQFQVDLFFLRIVLRDHVVDHRLLFAALDEVLSSTIDRCIEPSPLQQKIVEKIVLKEMADYNTHAQQLAENRSRIDQSVHEAEQ